MRTSTLLFFLLFSAQGLAEDNARQAPGLTASGDFCEVIWADKRWERISCFALSHDAGGVQLDGTAFTTKGWYGVSDNPTRFRLLAIGDLETCLGVDTPSKNRLGRYNRVAIASSKQLEACLPTGFAERRGATEP